MMIVIKNKDRKLWSVPICISNGERRKKSDKYLIQLFDSLKSYVALSLFFSLFFCSSFSSAGWVFVSNATFAQIVIDQCPSRASSYSAYRVIWNGGAASWRECQGFSGDVNTEFCGSGNIWNQPSQSCITPKNCSVGLHEINDQCVIAPQPINNGGTCPNYTTKPINISTGSKFFKQSDFVGGGNQPLAFSLYYNSSTAGAIWTSSYRQSLNITTDTIDVRRENGQVIPFELDNGVISPPSHRRENLVLNNGQYELTLANNTVEAYDTNGRLLFIRYTNGVSHQLTYSGTTIVVNRANESLILQLSDTTDDAIVTSIILPNNTTINYAYDTTAGYQRLLSAAYSDNSLRTYFYEDTRFPSYITSIEDENGHRISSVQYDDQGRAISSEAGPLNSGIERTQIEYHEDGSRTVTNALGKESTYHFTQFNGEYKMTQVEGHPSANCAGANQAYTYDSNGFMAGKTDWQGNVTIYIHNDRGQEVSRTEASGTSQARTIITDWHAKLNLPVKITEPEKETVMAYDSNGRMLSRQVQTRNN